MTSTAQWDWPRLRQLCEREARGIIRDPSDREDAVQEALVRAWRMRDACGTPDRPEPWVRQIARREALRRVVAVRAEVGRRGDGVDEAASGDHVPDLLDRLEVRRAVAPLDARDRGLLALRYVADLTQPQIADALGMPEGTVKVRLHRARKRLRQELEAVG